MRATICNLVLIWKYENDHMIITISSRQMRAIKGNSQSRLGKWHLFSRVRVRPPQSCFKAQSVCFMKNLSKIKINRVRAPIVNKTKIANGIFEFHSPSTVREGLNEKKTFSFGHCPNKGGGVYPCPNFFGPLSRSAFLVNKKSLFLQKCQCIEL